MLAIAVAAALVLAIGFAAAGTFSRGAPPKAPAGRPSAAVSATRYGDVAWVTAKTFAESIHPRSANTWGEIKARAFLFGAFQRYGYFPNTQEFIAGTSQGHLLSANIIAVKQGDSARQLIVGAHYDSARVGKGYIDNASGIGLLLETAARLKQRSTPYTVVFVAFGASESGLAGSRYYVRMMSSLERRGTIGVIDLDGVAGGPRLLVASRSGERTWLRDDALAAAQSLHIPLFPLESKFAAEPSDDEPFARAGVPSALLSSTNWRLTGGHAKLSPAAATAGLRRARADTPAKVEKTYPGRVRQQLHSLSRLLETLLTAKLETHP
jgi:alkaline phosphatase isozyme conversion protein